MSELFNKINSELTRAMKEKNELRLSVLRMIKSKVLYVNARGNLPEAEILKIVKKYNKDLLESVEEFKKLGKNDEVGQLEKEIAIVKEFLPPELSPEEIKKIVKETIAKTGAASIKEMGKVMKEISSSYPSIDGKIASQIVRESLQ